MGDPCDLPTADWVSAVQTGGQTGRYNFGGGVEVAGSMYWRNKTTS